MSVISTPEATPSGGNKKDRWAIDLPYLWVGGTRVQAKGGRPTWHPTIHFVGYAGLTRTLLAIFGPATFWTSTSAYCACIALSMITGGLIQKASGERVPRIFSAILGTATFALGTVSSRLIPQHGAASIWPALVVPISVAVLAVVANVVGEALICWFPVREQVSVQVTSNDRPKRWQRWAINPK